jgi:cystathionine gamma-synthase
MSNLRFSGFNEERGVIYMTTVKIETLLAQLGNRSETQTGTVNPPIYLSTAYRHDGIGESTGFDYIRTGNPTRKLLEAGIAELEGGKQGFAYSSGMAAIHSLLCLFAPGDEIAVSADLYGGTYRLFEQIWKTYGVKIKSCHTYSDFVESITERTKAFFIETPTNPLMQEMDIREIAQLTRANELLLIVDNTFYTPILQRPLEQGADIVVHSATKYLAGHNDVLAGLIVAKSADIGTRLEEYQNATGAVLSPFDSWLVMRGMKTLSLRMKQHEENAKKISHFLKEREEVTDVLYPGKGGMISFRLKSAEWVNPFLKSLNIISFAESLGGVESLMTYPATQTHADIPEEVRIQNGVCNCLLRYSVGIEHIDDLILDLRQAFESVLGK